ncbi:hypothetical protein [Thiopseudomonas alkaliphila]|uniref:Lipoprotein n=1 Tax=Thiopseudomonas alkaliphila TaxID=1697053 RepID=A0A0K1XEG3_9GAMM|nr:hypothetical protein [Thiopseudomonas alkaliphila]AKX59736.1 hypothetical protein AKN88_07205 [Thiopseudomonas alkaliphila]MDM1716894.1 hypothetical protein [Thiopseudomonas alkaliphila]
MFKKIAFIAIGIVMVGTTGCTLMVRTEPVPTTMAVDVPAERHLAFTEEKPGYAKLVVVRDKGMMGGGCYMGVAIAGELAARLDTKEKATFYVPPGMTKMSAVADPQGRGLCGSAWDYVIEEYDIKLDANNIYRISLGAYRRPRITPTAY